MKKILLWLFTLIIGIWSLNFGFCDNTRFDDVLWDSTDSIKQHLDNPVTAQRWEWWKELTVYLAEKILLPISILMWIIVAIIGFYKIMFSENSEEESKWRDILIYGTVWILIMMSAAYIWITLVWGSGWWGILGTDSNLDGIQAAADIYEKIIFPFLKLIMYLIVWILFATLVINFISFIWNPSEDIKQHSKRIIIWNTIWILIIMWAKNLTELVYWQRENIKWWMATNLWDIGWWILSDKNIDFIYNIINWFSWLISFLLLVTIIYQALLLITQPYDEEEARKLKMSLIYWMIGIALIWCAYLFTNFMFIK